MPTKINRDTAAEARIIAALARKNAGEDVRIALPGFGEWRASGENARIGMQNLLTWGMFGARVHCRDLPGGDVELGFAREAQNGGR